jgi:YVTN family beta-propeller protein
MTPRRRTLLAGFAVAAMVVSTNTAAIAAGSPASLKLHFSRYSIGTGSFAEAVGIDPRHRTVYAANANGTADVLNEATGRLLEYPVGVGPYAIGVDPHRGAAVIAAKGSDEVDILNSHGVAKVVHLPAGSGPSAVFLDAATHIAYVAESGRHRLVMIRRGKRIGHINVGEDPSAVTADASSGLIYVANAGSNAVTMIHKRKVVATAHVGGGPTAVAVNPRTHRAYVTDTTAAEVSILHRRRLAATVTLPSGTRPSSVAVAPAIDVAYVSMTGAAGDEDACVGAAAAVIVGVDLSQIHPAKSTEDCLGSVLVNRVTSTAIVLDPYSGRRTLLLHQDHEITASNLPHDLGFGQGADVAGSRRIWLPGANHLYRMRTPTP